MVCWVGARYIQWVLLLLVMFHSILVQCCIEEERLALLEIQTYMKSYQNTNYYGGRNGQQLWSFGIGDKEDCCQWSEVHCNVKTGRVTELNLGSKVILSNHKPWLFNVTLFRPFTQLISLSLSSNHINGLVEEDGSTNISTLKNLQGLSLDDNKLEIGYISVRVLTSLRILTLISAGLNESSFPIAQELGNLSKLQALDLSDNYFSGEIQGSWLCRLRNLQELSLINNTFNGRLPPCLNNLTSLTYLELSNNELSKELPDMSNLKSLEYLGLASNNFEGKFFLHSFANHSNLQNLIIAENRLQVQTEGVFWRPTFQLQMLILHGCSLNIPHGTFPTFLLYQYNLTMLVLSNNNLVGPFPTWLLNNYPNLLFLRLSNNSLTNLELPHNNVKQHNMSFLFISSNKFQGELPKSIGFVFPNITMLDISFNLFEGQIPSSLGQMRYLETLIMSNNNFSGKLPSRLLNNSRFLSILQLSNNNLQGNIMLEDMNLPSFTWFEVNNNNFSGTIKDGLMRSSSTLLTFDISNNKVKGMLPNWIGNLSSLKILSVSNNSLKGQIPPQICKLQPLYLDLSENSFTGTIPSCSNFSTLQYFHLHKNYNLTVSISNILSNFPEIVTLDLVDTRVTGIIPWWINKFQNLRVLQLGGNELQGKVPLEICELSNIDILDLSRNNLSGNIPACFRNMSFGKRSATPIKDRSSLQYNLPEEVTVLVKNDYRTYTGGYRLIMSVLDLSCNSFSGFIPSEIGELEHVHSLNLSHNMLSGSIPGGFSNLQQVESLDLSFNNLYGEIPSQLVELNSLAIFNVSYNNLTGRVPVSGQFGSFGENNYLSGFPGDELHNNKAESLPPANTEIKDGGDEDREGAFVVEFLWSFGMSCGIMFLATIIIMYINPRWRQTCFDFVDWYLLWWLPMSWRSLY
ncbi:receptor-like protein 14 [Spinacia oleracea]|uniref:Receptor-like protein 14 n=1 Tax=Spinacia oleracea TaxID=3562 RepID=A0ABM3QHI6_SPIOL|nr:receptor-like protein 14 [Spinacia oleracea]